MAHCTNETAVFAATAPSLRRGAQRVGSSMGVPISSLGGIRCGRGPLGLGRLGGFAVNRTARAWQNLLLLTNAHVLHAHGASRGDPVYQPDVVATAPHIQINADSLHTLALITAASFDGHHLYSHRGAPARDFYLDCATAALINKQARPAGQHAFDTVSLAVPEDIRPGRGLPVRLLGLHERAAGRLVDTAATVPHADGRLCRNSLVIESLPGQPPFASEGDSGAVVVDDFGRAIGLLWGIDLAKPTRAFACHLPPVLDRLKLVLSRRESAQ